MIIRVLDRSDFPRDFETARHTTKYRAFQNEMLLNEKYSGRGSSHPHRISFRVVHSTSSKRFCIHFVIPVEIFAGIPISMKRKIVCVKHVITTMFSRLTVAGSFLFLSPIFVFFSSSFFLYILLRFIIFFTFLRTTKFVSTK